MTLVRRTAIASMLAVGLLTAAAVPAFAGDSGAATRSPVGDWRTSTRGVAQTITFTEDGKVFGDSGCNRFTGGYTTAGDRITIGPLASTMMACEESVMNAEATFLTRIQAAVGYSATKKVLKIYAPKDMVRFVRR